MWLNCYADNDDVDETLNDENEVEDEEEAGLEIYTGYSSEITDFSDFEKKYPMYTQMVSDYIKKKYKIYSLVCEKARIRLAFKRKDLEFAKAQAMGILLRHGMETILTNLLTENGKVVSERMKSNDKIQILNKGTSSYITKEEIAILDKARQYSNEIAHPHVLSDSSCSYEKLKLFYKNSFRKVLVRQINYAAQNAKEKYEKIETRETKRVLKYLKMVKSELDHFSVFRKNTNVLLQGCFMRQLTECLVNLWAYNFEELPTDVSSEEKPIVQSELICKLKAKAKNDKSIEDTLENLRRLKNHANDTMHVIRNGEFLLPELGEKYLRIRPIFEMECAPRIMKRRLGESGRYTYSGRRYIQQCDYTSPSSIVLMCTFLGIFGGHYFYVGRKAMGFLYLLFHGFYVGPIIDLFKMLFGKFTLKDGSYIRHNVWSRLLNFLIVFCQFAIIILFASLVISNPEGDIGDYIIKLTAKKWGDEWNDVELCEVDKVSRYDKIEDLVCSASSYLMVGDKQYPPELCVDGLYDTCWQDGVNGNGVGESLTFTFDRERQISGFIIHNGQSSNEKKYYDNARVKELKIYVNGVDFWVSFEDSTEEKCVRFIQPTKAKEITLVIEEVYDGAVWDDLCISEVEIYG